ncbi:DNA repair protein RecO [Pseudofrankia asymbiotica]|uniref:DNA repair protein RecO n=1 Tax=Pseudofrankia asymbiotica TaxID=1834516 RepID=A0A1V2I3M3_9ACTN|nr:DNA repair protein RecO [Pseudofrankia asymbiotica]ONH24886.1 DNA repair protein RecO [Pseudofrankia asymbiotica]
MPVYRDEGVVLRTMPLGEADRIVTLFTRRNGRVRAVAKGIRRTSSRFGARLEPAMYVDLQLHQGRSSLDTVTQAVLLAPYGAVLAGDYGRHTAAAVMLETSERLTSEEREPALRLFLLLVGGLRTLASGEHPSGLVLDAFLLRALAVSGYGMALDDCVHCGEPGPHPSVSVAAGGIVCPRCRPRGAASASLAAVGLLADLLHGDWAGAEATDARTRRESAGLVAAYLQWHLERGLRALPHLERA